MLKVMFALTCIKEDGLRGLWNANRGCPHFESLAKAEAAAESVKKNNDKETLEQYCKGIRADAIFCYDHGDAIGIYVDGTPIMDAESMKHLVAWVNAHVQERGRISQAGMVIRIANYIKENEIPFERWDWSELSAKVS